MHHNTYLAIVNHGGEFRNRSGRTFNWIEELKAPMMRCVDHTWNRVLIERIPASMLDGEQGCSRLVDGYTSKLDQIEEFSSASVQTQYELRKQSERLRIELEQMWEQVRNTTFQDRITASRAFKSGLSSPLKTLFVKAADDCNDGVCTRIQQRLESGINVLKSRMFGGGAQNLVYAVHVSLNRSKDLLNQSLQYAFDKLEQDCKNLFGKRPPSHRRPSIDQQIRILEIIREIEKLMSDHSDAVRTSATHSSSGSGDVSVRNAGSVKPKSHSRRTRAISPTGYSSNESSAGDGKEEDELSVESFYD